MASKAKHNPPKFTPGKGYPTKPSDPGKKLAFKLPARADVDKGGVGSPPFMASNSPIAKSQEANERSRVSRTAFSRGGKKAKQQ
jgi:hypothetical protein